MQELLDAGENVNSYYDRDIYRNSYTTLLAKACREGCVDIVEFLLRNGANTEISSINGDTPLIEAASEGFFEVVELLIQYGANIGYKTPNRWAALKWCETRENIDKPSYQQIAKLLENLLWPPKK
jgi:ankyrin repeat protein